MVPIYQHFQTNHSDSLFWICFQIQHTVIMVFGRIQFTFNFKWNTTHNAELRYEHLFTGVGLVDCYCGIGYSIIIVCDI